MRHSKEFRDAMVSKLLSPGGPTIVALAAELGLGKSTLWRWKNEFKQEGGSLMSKPRRPQDWPADEKFMAIMETASMTEEELGVYFRRTGLTSSQLRLWKETCLASIRKGPKVDPEKKDLEKEVKALKRDLRRKDKALAETAALLVLKKKAAQIWGYEEDEDD